MEYCFDVIFIINFQKGKMIFLNEYEQKYATDRHYEKKIKSD